MPQLLVLTADAVEQNPGFFFSPTAITSLSPFVYVYLPMSKPGDIMPEKDQRISFAKRKKTNVPAEFTHAPFRERHIHFVICTFIHIETNFTERNFDGVERRSWTS
jgi:hypothetical protein